MKKSIALSLSVCMILSLCACSRVQRPEIEPSISASLDGSSVVSIETEASSETSEETTVESTLSSSLPYMRTIEYTGQTLRDGFYLIQPVSIDLSSQTCLCDIGSYYWLTAEDINLLQSGDDLYMGTKHLFVTTNAYCGFYYMELTDDSGVPMYWLVHQFNDTYFMAGDDDIWYAQYNALENYPLNISPDLKIFDSMPFFGISEAEYKQNLAGFMTSFDGQIVSIPYEDDAISEWYLNNPEGANFGFCGAYGFQYRTIEDFAYAWNECGPGGTNILAVVENETIIAMYLNPEMHQGWRFVSADKAHAVVESEQLNAWENAKITIVQEDTI